jgi:hypothetical protein
MDRPKHTTQTPRLFNIAARRSGWPFEQKTIGKIGNVFSLVAEMTLTVLGMRSRIRAKLLKLFGAGEGNRTLVFSLEGCCSTIELHPRAGDELSRHGRGLNRYAPVRPCSRSQHRAAPGLLTGGDSLPILGFPSTTKGGDPVSYTKRCHLAGIAR